MSTARPIISTLDIMVVEDNALMRDFLGRVLEIAGATQVRLAPDGRSALSALTERPADLVLLDHSMPGMSGVELVQHLRAPECPARNAQVLMLSGHASADHAAAARAAGADDVLVKPVSPRALLERIEALLAERADALGAAPL